MDTQFARRQMVDQQVRTWEVLDVRVLDALAAIPREKFVPKAYSSIAYADAAVPIGEGQHLLAPKLQGRILQSLEISPLDRILEVGTGTGYLTAALALLGAQTTSVEIHPELSAAAAEALRFVAGVRAQLQVRDVFSPEPLGEYDVIALTGSLPVYDVRFERALRIGGRMFVVVGTAPMMEARLVRRVDTQQWIRETLFETVIDPLENAVQAPRFVF